MAADQLPIVITGVASGIGARTAQVLAGRGAPLIGIDRNAPTAFDGVFIQADLSTNAGVEAAAAAVAAAAPQGVAGLANIAGVPGTAPWRTVLAVNVFGVRGLVRALAPLMAEGSAVVNLASNVGVQWRTVRDRCAEVALAEDQESALDAVAGDEEITAESYLFSKQCVRFLTEHLAAELLPRRIRVNSVSPGPVATPILEDFKQDHGRDKVEGAGKLVGRFGEPEDIARVVDFLLRPESAWVNGSDIRVDGGLAAYRGSVFAQQNA
ncbi:SDR family oxidoreductase [Arthrobacter sp. I2-34]|uniref:SDR family oxidoreductase n=1 Tax=Arthrobacter hankyongi TaxID=2904801 RepID=A0ABS9L936_9MICC|nr:SDR family oxidoreductase [Arthrobacter hankyongi]MCG2623184.1 SDR family oxidoreductase [Arthrobacter hankyongi]